MACLTSVTNHRWIICFLLYLFMSSVQGLSAEWIVRQTLRSNPYQNLDVIRSKRQTQESNAVDVRLFNVESKIAVRFASTTIKAKLANTGDQPRPIAFTMQLPRNAYVSNFTIEVDDVTYYGHVLDKCNADDLTTFDASGSLSSGRIESIDPTRNTFMISVNVGRKSRAAFSVTYQELLERVGGWYTQRVSVQPNQVVRDYRIQAFVTEPQGIRRIESGFDMRPLAIRIGSVVSWSSSGYLTINDESVTDGGNSGSSGTGTVGGGGGGGGGGTGTGNAVGIQCFENYCSLNNFIIIVSTQRASLHYEPSRREQQEVGGVTGLSGDFILRYDVNHGLDVGDVTTVGDVFVHHFSPEGFLPVRKNVAFVIDVSGSMFGQKLRQTKAALKTILNDMRSNDQFNIIAFSDQVYYWKEDRLVRATSSNVEKAKVYIDALEDLYGTNLNAAMLAGLRQLQGASTADRVSGNGETLGICILFVLTDGVPSAGETNLRVIEGNIQNANQDNCAVVTLGFGVDVDFNFLVRLALQNNGVARKIYEDADASAQLKGVYDEVATPLLFDIIVDYLNNVVDPESLSSTIFSNYFNGSELAITGKLINPNTANLPIRITAKGTNGTVEIEEYVPIRTTSPVLLNTDNVPGDFAERTWAFITLSQLFNAFTVTDNVDKQREIIERSVALSEQYNLLTPLMSMSFGDSPAVVGSTNAVTERTPPGLQWGIQGPVFGGNGQGASAYSIGASECLKPPATKETPTVVPNNNDLYNLRIVSKITERYARTTVTGDISNTASSNNDVTFTYQIPQNAFISNVHVLVDGKEYVGKVQDIRNPQWRLGPSTVSSDGRVILVTKRDPTKDTITLRVLNVDPNGIAHFTITYDELLQRRRGYYDHRINIWPGQVVEDMEIDVYITEPQGIEEINAGYKSRGFEGSIDRANLDDTIRRNNRNRARIHYIPTRDEQLDYGLNGIDGDFVISYDVFHTSDGSHSQVQDGYFVHFFSPTSFRHAAKHVVFVIDISASMAGTKLTQTKTALDAIFDHLAPNDRFNILAFSDDIEHWRSRRLVPASISNLRDARIFVNNLMDRGETNITAAILEADRLLDQEAIYDRNDEKVLSMMIVLSDGKPTRGITDPNEIIQTVDAALDGKHALFALGFVSVGRNVSLDFNLLLRLALRNSGQARKIYSTTDVSDQLTNFYFEISKPFLFDIEMDYPGGIANPETLTDRFFSVFFEGSELVSAGKLYSAPTSDNLRGNIDGSTSTGVFQRTFNTDITLTSPELLLEHAVADVVERIWTMKTIQDLIDEYAVTDDPRQRNSIADRITELALPYNFVTPITPLLLTNEIDGQPANPGKIPLPTVVHSGPIQDALKVVLEGLNIPDENRPVDQNIRPINTESSEDIDVTRISIESLIALRFSMTTVTTSMQNVGMKPSWAVFRQKLPNEAFVTGFSVTINGKTYSGEANQIKDNIWSDRRDGALETGHGGGYVTQLDPDTKLFLVSLLVKPGQTAVYTLTYEALILRRHGMYEQRYGLYPGQLVDDLRVDVEIVEPQGIQTGNAVLVDKFDHDMRHLIRKERDTHWIISYRPSIRDQSRIAADGIMGDFVVQYDVIHPDDTGGGTIQAQNDFFVHHFSPTWLTVLKKNVIFVIDSSSSMAGTKLVQTKDALKTILSDMRRGDKFNILAFSNQVDFLDRYKMVEVNPDNVEYAKEYVDSLRERDATNLYQAIKDAINMLRRDEERRRGQEEIISMLIVLTDGEPTYGLTDPAEIEKNVRDTIDDSYSLFALGFGENVDFNFLTRLAVQNHGLARLIPVRADASDLLENFYDEVATPLLFDIEFFYSDGIKPKTLSERFFSNYFNGSELVIVGQLDEYRRRDDLTTFVYAKSATDELSLTAQSNTRRPSGDLIRAGVPADLVERLWAYHFIQTLLRERTLKEDNPLAVEALNREIVEKSLTYKFLNPFTTLTVTEGVGGSEVTMSVTEKELPAYVREELNIALSPRQIITVPDPSPEPTTDTDDVDNGGTNPCIQCPCENSPSTDDVITLLHDNSLGLYLGATIITGLSAKNGNTKVTVLTGYISLIYQPPGTDISHRISFDPEIITLNSIYIINWGEKWELPNSRGGLSMRVKGRKATVNIGSDISISVDRHRASDNGPANLELLLEDQTGLSRDTVGLIINAKE